MDESTNAADDAPGETQECPKSDSGIIKWLARLQWVELIMLFFTGWGVLLVFQEAREDKRAWVLVSNVTVDPLEPDKELTFRLEFKNSGDTPATAQYSARYILANEPIDAATLSDVGKEQEGSYLIAPDSSFFVRPRFHTARLSPEGVAAFRANAATLFIIGRISYTDAFGETHETRYCFYIKGDSGGAPIMFEKGNSAN